MRDLRRAVNRLSRAGSTHHQNELEERNDGFAPNFQLMSPEHVDDESALPAARSRPDVSPPALAQLDTVFSGRTNELHILHQHLSKSHGQGPESSGSVAIWGLSGVGKTQLALAYAHQHYSEYEACLWVHCEPYVGIGEEFAQIARALGIEHGSLEKDLISVKNWFKANGKLRTPLHAAVVFSFLFSHPHLTSRG